jgi:hypothetical protein
MSSYIWCVIRIQGWNRYCTRCLLNHLFVVVEHGFRIIQPAQVENKKACLKNTTVPNFSPSVYTGRSSFQQSPSRSVQRLDQSRGSNGATGPFSSPSLLYSLQGSMHSTPPSYSSSPGCFAGGSGNRSPAGPLDMTSGSLRASFNSPSLVWLLPVIIFFWNKILSN